MVCGRPCVTKHVPRVLPKDELKDVPKVLSKDEKKDS